MTVHSEKRQDQMRRACTGPLLVCDPGEWDICVVDRHGIDGAQLPRKERKLACWYGLCWLYDETECADGRHRKFPDHLSGPDRTCGDSRVSGGADVLCQVLCQFFYYEFVYKQRGLD